MATYKEKVGTAVQNIAGDTGTVTGQLWYDSSDSEFKYTYQAYGNAWSTGANLNTARSRPGGAGSSNTNALAFGGNTPSVTGNTEAYDGSSWTEVSDMATARQYFGSAGSSSSNALAFGNVASTAATEEWTAADFEIKTLTTS